MGNTHKIGHPYDPRSTGPSLGQHRRGRAVARGAGRRQHTPWRESRCDRANVDDVVRDARSIGVIAFLKRARGTTNAGASATRAWRRDASARRTPAVAVNKRGNASLILEIKHAVVRVLYIVVDR